MVKAFVGMVKDQDYSSLMFIMTTGLIIVGVVMGVVLFATRNKKPGADS